MIEKLLFPALAILAVPVLLLTYSIVAHNLRIQRVRRDYRNLPVGLRERLLKRIDSAAENVAVCTLLVPRYSAALDGVADRTTSHFGGEPYAEAGDAWPLHEEGNTAPAPFLIQVRLGEPLPAPWAGRLIAVYLKFDATQTVRVYASPSSDKSVPLAGGPPETPVIELEPLRILKKDNPNDPMNDAFVAYDSPSLIAAVPGLGEELAEFSRRPADLLTQLIAPGLSGYGLEMDVVIQMGGRPEWIQGAETMTCSECGHPMRFLFQFADQSGQERLGDAGVCYVFGCDGHPDRVESIVQMF